jgi:hypothetical protein
MTSLQGYAVKEKIVHALKAPRQEDGYGSGGIAPLFLISALDGGE